MEKEQKNVYRCERRLFPMVKIISIERADDSEDDKWKWRLDYVGDVGSLVLTTFTEGEHSGESRFSFVGDRSLTTSCGKLLIEDRIITLVTKNTAYKLEITDELPAYLAGIGDMTDL